MWIRESEQNRIAAAKRARGIDCDVSHLSEWRFDADPDNLALLDFYGRYLVGQYAGMGHALNLDSLRAAFDLEAIPQEDRPDMTERIMVLHAAFVDCYFPKDK